MSWDFSSHSLVICLKYSLTLFALLRESNKFKSSHCQYDNVYVPILILRDSAGHFGLVMILTTPIIGVHSYILMLTKYLLNCSHAYFSGWNKMTSQLKPLKKKPLSYLFEEMTFAVLFFFFIVRLSPTVFNRQGHSPTDNAPIRLLITIKLHETRKNAKCS